MPVHVAVVSVVDEFLGEFPSGEALLLVASSLLLLGYVAMRAAQRLRTPVVTIFIVLGVVIGPSGVGLLSRELVEALDLIEPVALGFITFSAGEHLLLPELRRLTGAKRAAVALETVLPGVLVGATVFSVTGSAEMAVCLGTIAGTTGIATVVATLRESGASGEVTRLLNITVATDNVFAILAFSFALPAVTAMTGAGDPLSLYARGLEGIAVAVAVGVVAGVLLARSVGRVRTSSELLVLVLSLLLMAVSLGNFLGSSVLLVGLAMGITCSNLIGGERERQRVFGSLLPFEGPVIALFFIWAGATLQLYALGSVGAAAVAYVVFRSVGKVVGPFVVGLRVKADPQQSRALRLLGLAVLPQAGAAIGLAVLAGEALPVLGDEILTIVLASVVLFELAGPVTVRVAIQAAGESSQPKEDQPLTLTEALRRLDESTGRVVAVIDVETDDWETVSLLGLARRLGTELTLVSLDDPGGAGARPAAAPGPSITALLEQEVESLDLGLTVLRRPPDDPVEDLIGLARSVDADLLILAWGRPGNRALSPGLVERAPCPVVELPAKHPALDLVELPRQDGRRRRAGEVVGGLRGVARGAWARARARR